MNLDFLVALKPSVVLCCVIHVHRRNVVFCYCLCFECFEYCDECLLSFSCGACLDVAGVRGGCPTPFFFTSIFLKVNTHHSNYMYDRKKNFHFIHFDQCSLNMCHTSQICFFSSQFLWKCCSYNKEPFWLIFASVLHIIWVTLNSQFKF